MGRLQHGACCYKVGAHEMVSHHWLHQLNGARPGCPLQVVVCMVGQVELRLCSQKQMM